MRTRRKRKREWDAKWEPYTWGNWKKETRGKELRAFLAMSTLKCQCKVQNHQNYTQPKMKDAVVWTSVPRQCTCNHTVMVIRLRAAQGGRFRGERWNHFFVVFFFFRSRKPKQKFHCLLWLKWKCHLSRAETWGVDCDLQQCFPWTYHFSVMYHSCNQRSQDTPCDIQVPSQRLFL